VRTDYFACGGGSMGCLLPYAAWLHHSACHVSTVERPVSDDKRPDGGCRWIRPGDELDNSDRVREERRRTNHHGRNHHINRQGRQKSVGCHHDLGYLSRGGFSDRSKIGVSPPYTAKLVADKGNRRVSIGISMGQNISSWMYERKNLRPK
jgi:hypothetical protein